MFHRVQGNSKSEVEYHSLVLVGGLFLTGAIMKYKCILVFLPGSFKAQKP